MRLFAVVLLIIAISANPGCHAHADLITADQAKQSVWAFENDSGIAFASVVMKTWADDSSLQYYELTCGSPNGDDRKSWNVNPATGEVTSAMYLGALIGVETTDEPSGPMTQSACHQAALAYVRARYSGFDSLNMVEHDPEWAGDGWRFSWEEKLADGATTPNFADVEVSAQTGRIQTYNGHRVATPNPPAPQLTPQEAIAAAAQGLGIVNVIHNTEPELLAGATGIYYGFQIGGEDADGNGQLYEVTVDAVTGQVDWSESPQVSQAPSDDAPVSARPTIRSPKAITPGSIALRDLQTALPGSSIKWIGKAGVKFTAKGTVYEMKPGDKMVKANGKKVQLSDKIVLKNGKLMIPQELADRIKKDAAHSAKPQASHGKNRK